VALTGQVFCAPAGAGRAAASATRASQAESEPRYRNATLPITRTKSTARSHPCLAASTPGLSLRRHSDRRGSSSRAARRGLATGAASPRLHMQMVDPARALASPGFGEKRVARVDLARLLSSSRRRPAVLSDWRQSSHALWLRALDSSSRLAAPRWAICAGGDWSWALEQLDGVVGERIVWARACVGLLGSCRFVLFGGGRRLAVAEKLRVLAEGGGPPVRGGGCGKG